MGRSAHLSKPSCRRRGRDAHAISAKSATPSAAAIKHAHPAAATSVRRRAAGAGKPSTSALDRPVASPATVSTAFSASPAATAVVRVDASLVKHGAQHRWYMPIPAGNSDTSVATASAGTITSAVETGAARPARLRPRRPPALLRLSNRPASRECEERRSATVRANRTPRVSGEPPAGEAGAAPRAGSHGRTARRARAPSTRAAPRPLRPERVRRAAPHERHRRQPECRLSPKPPFAAEHVQTRIRHAPPRCPAAASTSDPSRSARRPRSGGCCAANAEGRPPRERWRRVRRGSARGAQPRGRCGERCKGMCSG